MRTIYLRALELPLVIILGLTPLLLSMGQSSALELSNRSVTISTATPSAVATHTFQMTLESPAAIGSIVFEYCSNSPIFNDSCTPPAGLSVSGAALTQQSGNTGFVIDSIDSTASQLVISRPLAAAAAVPSSYTFSNIINPSVNNGATYVRISTYASTEGVGSYIDNGSVAFSTTTNFEVGAYVPPFLNLCVGVTVATDCSSASGYGLNFGIMTPQTTRSVTSQFAAATNDVSGFSTYVLGTTMTSGNNVIPAMSSPESSLVGVSEFGINLRANSDPPVGQDPSGIGTSVPTSDYNSPNSYSFVPGSEIAVSPISSSYNRMTVSYIVNVDSTQAPGIYSTTITYLVSAQF